jgi:hypothetical protein
MTGNNTQPISFANLYTNDGSGNFSLVSDTPFQPSSEGDIAFEDIDNDNDLDLMMVGYDPQGNGFTKLYANNGAGTYTELFNSNFEPAKAGSIAFIDFDNDDDPDVIVAGENNSGLLHTNLYENDGTGLFTSVSNTPFPGVAFGDIAVADTDNDGDQDVLLNGSVGGTSHVTSIYLNNGAGGFSILENTNFPQTSLSNAEFADFDNDGDMDVLITGFIIGSQFVSDIYENDGANTFIFADTLNPMYLTSAAIDDIDGDGDLDVIIVGINNTPSAFKTRTFINNLTSVGMYEIASDAVLTVYPNPSNDLVHIISNKDLIREIELYSMSGSIVFRTELNSDYYKLNVRDYPSGPYIIRTTDENHQITTTNIIVK